MRARSPLSFVYTLGFVILSVRHELYAAGHATAFAVIAALHGGEPMAAPRVHPPTEPSTNPDSTVF